MVSTSGSRQSLTVVIKLGTSSIVDERTREPLLSILSLIVETAARLRKDGHKVILVSSGAIGVGLRRMDIAERPKHLPQVQVCFQRLIESVQDIPIRVSEYQEWNIADRRKALAAVGQSRLMSLWDSLFGHLHIPVAQILLTRNDIADRSQYINAQNTISELLSMGVVPIVNENDTLAVAEIKFGDNDTLSAITAAMVRADYLFLMTDVDCLYTSNPRHDPNAKPIEVVSDIRSLQADVSSAGSSLGTGGMSTKIVAARLATSAGVTTIITKSSEPGNVSDIVNFLEESHQNLSPGGVNGAVIGRSSVPLHTRFLPSTTPIRSRSFWLLHGLTTHGAIYIDQGAYTALLNKAGLLPAGVVAVDGHFSQQEAVQLYVVDKKQQAALDGHFPSKAEEPKEVGRALVNYGSTEINRIKGFRSTQIQSILGYADSEYIALRQNISFYHDTISRPVTPSNG